jgi:hypothetical protein
VHFVSDFSDIVTPFSIIISFSKKKGFQEGHLSTGNTNSQEQIETEGFCPSRTLSIIFPPDQPKVISLKSKYLVKYMIQLIN